MSKFFNYAVLLLGSFMTGVHALTGNVEMAAFYFIPTAIVVIGSFACGGQ